MKDKVMSNERVSAIPGYAVIGLFATGIVGLLLGTFQGNGLGLIAAALAFGVVCHVSYR